jgi:hypothetical protein
MILSNGGSDGIRARKYPPFSRASRVLYEQSVSAVWPGRVAGGGGWCAQLHHLDYEQIVRERMAREEEAITCVSRMRRV